MLLFFLIAKRLKPPHHCWVTILVLIRCKLISFTWRKGQSQLSTKYTRFSFNWRKLFDL